MKKVLYIILFAAGITACSRQGFENVSATSTRHQEWFSDTTGHYHNEQEFRAYWASVKDSTVRAKHSQRGWGLD